ncbi:MAG: hypothetical protein EXR72_01300 [Myxococcales bacterium]|nr:hypothetical protein [Myxococcales bacterium]
MIAQIDPAPESRLVAAVRTLVFAAAAGAAVLDIALTAGWLGAVVGTVLAALAAGRLARSRVRLFVVWAGSLIASWLGILVAGWLVDGNAAAWIGPRVALEGADLVRYGVLGMGAVLVLRTTAVRYPVFAVGELIAVALALAGVTAAHRDGAINHPRWLSDWALSTGRDPQHLLLAFGAGTLVLLVLALLRERRGRGGRVLLHLGSAAVLAALLLLLFRVLGPPHPRGGGIGQGAKESEARVKGARNGGGERGAARGGDQLTQLEFQDDYSSKSQDSPVAVVILHDDYSPPLGYYYFRQTAFSQYNGRRLVARTRDDIDRDILTEFPTGRIAVPDAPEGGESRERTVVHTTVALLAEHARPFGLESPTEFVPRDSPDAGRFQRLYDVTSSSLALRYEDLLGRRSSRWTAGAAAAYTGLPDDPRYRELADRIVQTTLRPEHRNDPFAQAIAISSWLGKNGIYSTRSQHAGAGDPTADFLFGDRTGYCVHFSHAAAFLLRARGLPTRIAAGYVADEGRRGSGSTLLLRQKDAHAWAELYLDGFGWIIVDVAPERSLDPPDTPPDPDLQRMLGELARGDPRAGKLPPRPGSGLDLGRIGRWAALGLLGLLALLYAVKLWRLAVPSLAGTRHVHRVAYRAALDRLAELGWRRAPGETRERFAARLGAVAPALGELTREHIGRAFGSTLLAPPEEMLRLARTSTREARQAAPFWLRLLGALDPTSWLRTR